MMNSTPILASFMIGLSILFLVGDMAAGIAASLVLLSIVRVGAMGIPILVFACSPMLGLIERVVGINIPIVAVLLILATAAGIVESLRRGSVIVGRLLWVSLLTMSPFLILCWINSDSYATDSVRRLTLFTASSLLWAAPIFLFASSRFRIDRMLLAVFLGTFGVYGSLYASGVTVFSRESSLAVLDIGRAGAVLAGLALACIVVRGEAKDRSLLQEMLLLFFAIMLPAIALARQGFVAFLVFAVVLVISGRSRTFSAASRAALTSLIGLIALFGSYVAQTLDARHYSLFDIGSRRPYFDLAVDMINSRPLIGGGIGSFGYEFGVPEAYPHNFVLEILAETGVFGAIALIAAGLLQVLLLGSDRSFLFQMNSAVVLALMTYWMAVSSVSYSLQHSLGVVPLVAAAILAVRHSRRVVGTSGRSRFRLEPSRMQ